MQINDQLRKLKAYALDEKVPIVRQATALRLQEEVKTRKPKKILEIGTAIGYSALLMKDAYMDAEIITIEKDETRYKEAVKNIEDCNISGIKCVLGDAFEVLDELVYNGEKFDFVFLDGPKGYYYRYINKIIPMLNNNSCVFADNVAFFGMVESGIYPHRHKTIVVSLQNYLALVSKTPFVSEIDLKTDDGYAISTYNLEESK